jgi:hypothetical protein
MARLPENVPSGTKNKFPMARRSGNPPPNYRTAE